MYLESILFKRAEISDWEKGYYLGDTDNSLKSILVDINFNPLDCTCWDYCVDTDEWVQYRASRSIENL